MPSAIALISLGSSALTPTASLSSIRCAMARASVSRAETSAGKEPRSICRAYPGSHSATPAAIQQHVLKMMLAPPESTASGAMIATFDTANLNDFVTTVPVLGIYAGNAPMTNRENLKKVFPNSEYVQVAGTGHFVMMERPDEFNRLLIAFLGKVKF